MHHRDIYTGGIKYFALSELTKAIVKPMIAGDDKANDFEDALKTDALLSRQIILAANLQLKNSSVQSISHAVVLIGKNRVRDFIFSNCILQSTTSDEPNFEKIAKQKNFLKYAEQAEDNSKKLGADFAGSAWAAGFLFDLLENLLITKGLQQNFGENFKSLWQHSLKTAALAFSFANISKMPATLCRQVFLAGLCHEIGRPVLWLVYPTESLKTIDAFSRSKKRADGFVNISAEVNSEMGILGISHCEVGSMLLLATDYLNDIEEIVAFHHQVDVLRTRAASSMRLVECVNLADQVADLLDSKIKVDQQSIETILAESKPSFSIGTAQILDCIERLKSKQI